MQTSADNQGTSTILIGEDESDFRNYLELAVRSHGYEVHSAADGEEVLDMIRGGQAFNAVLLDLMMPGRDGIDTLEEIRRFQPDVPVIMLSGAASAGNVVRAMKCGATDFLSKPASRDELGAALRKAMNATPVPARWESPRAATEVRTSADSRSEGFEVWPKHSRITMQKVAASDLPVLLRGETGTGKEVVARNIHAQSPRADKPFIKLNCAAVPSELLESELFGYERGAFTGAIQKRVGLFQQAEGGTLLLDEIGDMDIRLQAKLLQVAQDCEFRPVGGKGTVRTDVRIIAATHRNLEEAILDGEFRADLFHRLNVFSVSLPPLRDRMEDLHGLAAHLIERHTDSRDMARQLLTPRLMTAMREYSWPGNVRELENLIRKLVVLQDPEAAAADLRDRMRGSAPQQAAPASSSEAAHSKLRVMSGGESSAAASSGALSPLERASHEKQEAERHAILKTLEATRWSRKEAAALLEIDYKALLYKMKKLGIGSKPEPTGIRENPHPGPSQPVSGIRGGRCLEVERAAG